MKYCKYVFCFLCSILIFFKLQAQIKDEIISSRYPFIHSILNRIGHESNLNDAYKKLYTLKTTGKGKLTIVHIGDSHLQAGNFTAVVRTGLQKTFGNAGRGMAFPYQLANTNAPADIKTVSNTSWQYNSIVHPEISVSSGVSGYAIQTKALAPVINIVIKDSENNNSFNKLLFFFDSSSTASWILHTDNSNLSTILDSKNSPVSAKLNNYTNNITIAGLPSAATKSFYGVSFEKDSSGVLYHTIGVNSATYREYNAAPLFWKQLGALNADVFIVSLGTNEAQAGNFTNAGFINDVDAFVKNLKHTSPNATIIITSPADSYENGKPNSLITYISTALYKYCNDNRICFWNMYSITNGYSSAAQWNRYGMLQADGVHFTADGYLIQGSLLHNAFMKGYNDFEEIYKLK